MLTLRHRLLVCGLFALLIVGQNDSVIAQQSGNSKPAGAKSAAKWSTPEWIWLTAKPGANDVVFFRKSFKVTGPIKASQLVATCDNQFTLYLNGEKVAASSRWEEPAIVDIAKKLREGDNQIAVEARNHGSAAGFICRMSITAPDNSRQYVLSDRTWLATAKASTGWADAKYDDKSWTAPHVYGPNGIEPWESIAISLGGGVFAKQATDNDKITIAKGFKVERLYSVPKDTQGSWVSMTADSKGRLIVSDQDGSLYRVTVGATEDDTKVEKIDVPIGQAQGLLWAFDSLYVVVNGSAAQGSGLYRVRDTNNDDRLDTVQLLKKFNGGGEHGPHAVRLGPDGKLWVIAGNHTKIPDNCIPTSPHRNWAEDHLLPRNPDGNGHATGVMAPGGWVAKTDADGKTWELFCGGFRNQYDIAFNQDGELFSFDADMEWDTGTPWYRPTRVNHAVSAAEFGWRYGTGKWPAYYADSLGAVVDIGLGSPTGIEFGTGAKFPAKYQRALFINDWTYGKIYAVHMRPAGASYTADFEIFAEAKPLPVTDICVNHDGFLYFAIGGRQTQSGLYRVRYVGDEATSPVGTIVDDNAAKARALRKQLEALHGHHDPRAIETAWPHLNSSDRSIRYAARVAIEHQDITSWREKALAEKRTTAIIQAMVALARCDRADVQPRLIAKLNELPWNRLTEEQTLDALRAYQLAFVRLGRPNPAVANSVVAKLNPLFPTQIDFVNRELCQVLIYLEAPTIVDRCMQQLKQAQTQQDQLHYAFVLRNAKTGWTMPLRQAYFSWLQLAENQYRGGASWRNFLIRIRKDAVEHLSSRERSALRDIIEGRAQVVAVKSKTTRQFVHNWQMNDLVPLLDQVEKGRSFKKGQEAYQVASCYKCHRFAGDGGSTGPDLTGAGNRFSTRDLLESILTPSKVISDQYRSSLVLTNDGEVITGRVIDEDDKKVRIRTDPFAKEPVEVAKADIESRQASPTSEMPQGAINVLTKEELLDLLAYLRSGGNEKDNAFKP